MPETLKKEYFDEQFETLITAVKAGFDGNDEQHRVMNARLDYSDKRSEMTQDDIADMKRHLAFMENEVRALSANMVTKQYLDAKIDELLMREHKDSLFKRTLLLALEQAQVLSPQARAKLEGLIA